MLNLLCRPRPELSRLGAFGRRQGVIKGTELQVASAADRMVADARAEAEAIREAARAEAQAMAERSRREARELLEKTERGIKRLRTQAMKEAEAEAWRRFDVFTAEWRQRCDAHVESLQRHAVPVVRKAIGLLVEEAPSEDRVRRGIRALVDDLGAVPAATLWLHPADLASLQAGDRAVPWPVRAEPSLMPGACRLVASSGEWESSFQGRFDRVLAAFSSAVAPAAQPAAAQEIHGLD